MRPARSSAGSGGTMSALWPRDPTRDHQPVGPLVAPSRIPAWTSQRQFPLCHVRQEAVGGVPRGSVLASEARHGGD